MLKRNRTVLRLLLFGMLYAAISIAAVLIANGESEKSITRLRERIATEAKGYIETPYQFGGTDPSGFDCSGFTRHVYSSVGLSLPRTSSAQFDSLKTTTAPQAGDLVFFRIDGPDVSHVGIYLGEDRFIHAPSEGKKITIANLNSNYWKTRFAGFKSPFTD